MPFGKLLSEHLHIDNGTATRFYCLVEGHSVCDRSGNQTTNLLVCILLLATCNYNCNPSKLCSVLFKGKDYLWEQPVEHNRELMNRHLHNCCPHTLAKCLRGRKYNHLHSIIQTSEPVIHQQHQTTAVYVWERAYCICEESVNTDFLKIYYSVWSITYSLSTQSWLHLFHDVR